MPLRDASDLLEHRVRATLDALPFDDADEAAKDLAIRYARVIDESSAEDPKIRAWAMRWIAPLLLTCLEQLGATPQARAALARGRKDEPAKPGGLAQLRATRK